VYYSAGDFMSRAIHAVLVCLLAGSQTAVPPLAIAAASDLQSVFPLVAQRFERETGQRVALTFGSSGNFFAQLQNGAPFDLFFSADVEYPRRLDASQLAEPGTMYEYATGRIVLWSRSDGGVRVDQGLAVLADPKVRRIAIANPDHAPYGRAAVAALQHEQLYDRVRSKLVLGENISQAAQFAQSGNADAGILALSLALAPALRNEGSYLEIPETFHPPLRQAAIVVRASRNKDSARKFLEFLKTPEIVRLMEEYGFRRI
jgi:molybdate transport system substrate-binding protein